MRHSNKLRVVPTGKRFQIRCERAANEEAKGDNLLNDKGGIRHLTAADALATIREQAIDRSDE
jgi:hypothetical protein